MALLRFTLFTTNDAGEPGEPDPGDLLLDSATIMSMVEHVAGGCPVQIVRCLNGIVFHIHDPDRTAALRWAEAEGEMIYEEDC